MACRVSHSATYRVSEAMMLLKSITGEGVELESVPAQVDPGPGGPVFRLAGTSHVLVGVTRAASTFFGMRRAGEPAAAMRGGGFEAPRGGRSIPELFREQQSGLLRMVHREIVIRFVAGTPERRRKAILNDSDLALRQENRLISDQIIVYDATGRRAGGDLIQVANELLEYEEILLSTPNFVSEFRRTAELRVLDAQWHLINRAKRPGQRKGEDIKASNAWKHSVGREDVVVAIVDDGVDVTHPNLRRNILRSPDPNEKRDKYGRDFYIPDDDDPEHFNPAPKNFQYPYNEMPGNDIHGTPCAGLVAAFGAGAAAALGVAPR
jgi:subtilisin family serine protease